MKAMINFLGTELSMMELLVSYIEKDIDDMPTPIIPDPVVDRIKVKIRIIKDIITLAKENQNERQTDQPV